MPSPDPEPAETAPRAPLRQLRRVAFLCAAGWVTVVTGSYWLEYRREIGDAEDFAAENARSSLDKDFIYRLWAARHGGVYVPPSPGSPPNPYLADVTERDVVTTSGKVLTLVNPAYMTRQVQELGADRYGPRAHITSLRPLRPENGPDDWERQALEAVERGEAEVGSLELVDGRTLFRLLRPITTEESCLKCHAHQGYKTGDIRGGLSVAVDLAPFYARARAEMGRQVLAHGLIGLLGLAGIVAAHRRIARSIRANEQTVAALRQSERRLVESLDRLPLLAVMLDRDGRIAHANPALLALTGWSAGEVAGRDWFGFFVPGEIRESVRHLFQVSLERREIPGSHTNEILTRAGERRRIAWKNSLVTDENGAVVGTMSLGEDITSAEAEQRQRRLLAQVVEESPVTVVITDTQGRIEYVNARFSELTGYRREEALGLNPRVLKSGQHPPEFYAQMWREISAGRPWTGEMLNRKKDGTLFWELARITPITDDEGRIHRYVAIKEDITARKAALASLKESESRFRAIFEASPMAIVSIAGGRYQYANAAAARLLGYDSPERLRGVDIWMHVQPEAVAWVNDRLQRNAAGLVNPPAELPMRRADGTSFVCESTTVPIVLDGEPGLLAMFTDITERRRALEALESSERRFRTLVESAPVAIVVLHGEQFLYANAAAARLLGYASAADLPGRLWSGHVTAAQRAALAARTGLPAGQGSPPPAAAELTRLDGRTVAVEAVSLPLEFTGQPCVLLLAIDVTERERLSRALHHSEARLRETIADTEAGYFLVGTDGRLRDANPAWLRLHGQPALAAAVGRPLVDFALPEERPALQTALDQLFAGGEPRRDAFRCRNARGECCFLTATMHAVRTEGAVSGVEGFVIDNTEAYRAREQYRMLFEQMQDGFALHEIICDAEGRPQDYRFLALNPAFERATGLRADRVLGRTVREIFPGVEQKWIDRYGRIALSGESARFEDFSAETGKHYAIAAFQPAPGQFACLVQDVTERLSLEQQLRQAQKMEAVGQLAGGVAHDYNNILVAILMNLALLRADTNLQPDTVASIEELEREAKRAAALTRQLLTFSRRQEMQVRSIDLNELVENILKMLRHLLGEHITITSAPAPRLPLISGDAGMLDQVLLNLAVNARDAMPGGGRLDLSTCVVEFDGTAALRHPDARPGQFVRLTVADTGCGMDAATLGRIFEPFFTTKEAGKGTGLGLATVFGIVKQHSGWIEVQSAPNEGTTFRLYLPVAASTETPAGLATACPAAAGHETVLLVEDDLNVRRTVALTLRQHGYQTLEARTAAQALDVWQRYGPRISALITDVVMPGELNGVALARRLRDSRPDLGIVIISGYSGGLSQDLSKLDGAEFIAKPFDYDLLAGAVRRVIDRASPGS